MGKLSLCWRISTSTVLMMNLKGKSRIPSLRTLRANQLTEYPNNSGARIFARMEPQRVPNDQDPEPADLKKRGSKLFRITNQSQLQHGALVTRAYRQPVDNKSSDLDDVSSDEDGEDKLPFAVPAEKVDTLYLDIIATVEAKPKPKTQAHRHSSCSSSSAAASSSTQTPQSKSVSDPQPHLHHSIILKVLLMM